MSIKFCRLLYTNLLPVCDCKSNPINDKVSLRNCVKYGASAYFTDDFVEHNKIDITDDLTSVCGPQTIIECLQAEGMSDHDINVLIPGAIKKLQPKDSTPRAHNEFRSGFFVGAVFGIVLMAVMLAASYIIAP